MAWGGQHTPWPLARACCCCSTPSTASGRAKPSLAAVCWAAACCDPPSQALRYEPGTHVVSSGALATTSGQKTGRSPKDKRVVREDDTEKVSWGVRATWLSNTKRQQTHQAAKQQLPQQQLYPASEADPSCN